MTVKNLSLSLVIPLVFFLLGLLAINDYGETNDEKFDQHIGQYYYYKWSESGIEGLEKRFIPVQRNYGPFFNVISVASHDYLHRRLNIIKSSVASYHFPVIVVTALAIWIVFLFALSEWGKTAAIFSSLSLALMPQIIAHSHNNLKDIPLMTFFSASIYAYYKGVTRQNIWYFVLGGILLGITYSIKINGIFIIPIIGLWGLLHAFTQRSLIRFLGSSLLSLLIAFGTLLIVWPYYRYDTLQRFVETFYTFKSHIWNDYVLYLGVHYKGKDIPWHFPFVMIGATTPLFFLIPFFISLFSATQKILKCFRESTFFVLLLAWLFLPVIAHIVSGAPKYDGVRHYFTIYPAFALLIGYGFSVAVESLRSRLSPSILYFSTGIIFATVFLFNVGLHPYQLAYFNVLEGGGKGASKKFDIDYWGASLKETAEWMNTNLPRGSRIWKPLPMIHHFPLDRGKFTFVRSSHGKPNYKVSVKRGMLKTWDTEEDYRYPQKPVVYSIIAGGATLIEVYHYPENEALSPGYEIKAMPISAQPQAGIEVTCFPLPEKDGKAGAKFLRQDINFNTSEAVFQTAVRCTFDGLIFVAKAGKYGFTLSSDDNSFLYIENRLVMGNGSSTWVAPLTLEDGYHPIKIEYYNDTAQGFLNLLWTTPDHSTMNAIPVSQLFYIPKQP